MLKKIIPLAGLLVLSGCSSSCCPKTTGACGDPNKVLLTMACDPGTAEIMS
jgi:hypothetical protein